MFFTVGIVQTFTEMAVLPSWKIILQYLSIFPPQKNKPKQEKRKKKKRAL